MELKKTSKIHLKTWLEFLNPKKFMHKEETCKDKSKNY